MVSAVLAGDDDRGSRGDGRLAVGGALPVGILCDQPGAIGTIVCSGVIFMGMWLNYHAFSPEAWESIQGNDPKNAKKLLFDEEAHFSLYESWGAMFFLIGLRKASN